MLTGTMEKLNLPEVYQDSILPYRLTDAVRYMWLIGRMEKANWDGVIPDEIPESGLWAFRMSDFEVLAKALDHEDATVRFAVTCIFARLNSTFEVLYEYLVRQLGDENRYVRIAAIMGICWFPCEETLKQLDLRAATDPDREIRQLARERIETVTGRLIIKDSGVDDYVIEIVR